MLFFCLLLDLKSVFLSWPSAADNIDIILNFTNHLCQTSFNLMVSLFTMTTTITNVLPPSHLVYQRGCWNSFPQIYLTTYVWIMIFFVIKFSFLHFRKRLILQHIVTVILIFIIIYDYFLNYMPKTTENKIWQTTSFKTAVCKLYWENNNLRIFNKNNCYCNLLW